MVVPLHLVWKLLIAASMAFFWAEDPSALRVPVGQSDAAVPVPAVAVFVASEPQAPRAKAPVIATMMMALLRVVITRCPSHRVSETVCLGWVRLIRRRPHRPPSVPDHRDVR